MAIDALGDEPVPRRFEEGIEMSDYIVGRLAAERRESFDREAERDRLAAQAEIARTAARAGRAEAPGADRIGSPRARVRRLILRLNANGRVG